MTGSFVYTALVVDAFAARIVGRECSASNRTAFVQRAITQAPAFRTRGSPLQSNAIHHFDAGSQCTAARFTELFEHHGLTPSIGTISDAYDNALAETAIGLYKPKKSAKNRPFAADH